MKKGYIYLILAALSYASMGALVKAISIDTGPYLQTFLRLGVSAIITAFLVAISRKPFILKNKSDYVLMFFMGVFGYGFSIILFTLAIYHTTISNTLFLLSGYPIITAFLAYFFLKEKITKKLTIALILLSISLLFIFQPNLGTSLLGNIYALGVGITTAFYIIASRIMSKRGNSPETITLWSVILAVATSGFMTVGFEKATLELSSTTILFLVIFGILNASAYNLINRGFSTVSAGTGTMILTLEPVIGTLIGLLLFQETPSLTFIAGATLLLTSVMIATFKNR